MSRIDSERMKERPLSWRGLFFLSLLAQIVAVVAIALAAPKAQAADPSLEATVSGIPLPGNNVTVLVEPQDTTASITSVQWTQTEGVPVAAFVTPDTANPVEVILSSSLDDYLARLIEAEKEAPVTAADLPEDLVLQEINSIEKGLQNRNQVVGVNPLAYEHAAAVVLSVQADLDDGTTLTTDVTIETILPWAVSTGVRTVAVDSTVLLYAKEDAVYNWSITEAPNGSSAELNNATTQTPWFTPDTVGTYRIQETACDTTDHPCADIYVHAGIYHGVIDPTLTLASVQFGDGRPVGDENCTGCHNGATAPANFDTWRFTGHAEAFTQGVTTNGHFGEACFVCHAVGFGTSSGIDSKQPNYGATPFPDLGIMGSGFLKDLYDAQHGGSIAGLWEAILDPSDPAYAPDVARLSNIQCENCHGPQSYTQAHHALVDQLDPYSGYLDGTPNGPRINLGSETCGSCHGEPQRHGRFQQWLLSNHADYDLAEERGTSENCARCHSGNGFIAWSKVGFDPDDDLGPIVDELDVEVRPSLVTWDADTVVPQVCASCHDPHDTGTTSGTDATDAKVRVMGDTHMLLAGFTANIVGKGATCMTCHNSRRGLRNDQVWDSLSDSEKTGGPHHGVQADLIMGQNMYFFDQNELIRGNHSLIEDTCVTCHMNATQPPAILSYNQAGTNHTFAADPGICAECHGLGGETLADIIDAIVTGQLADLESALGDAWERLLTANYPVTIPAEDCGGEEGEQPVVADADNNPITSVEWVYHRGTRLKISVNGVDCGGELDTGDILVGQEKATAEELSLQQGNDVVWKAMWNYGLLYEDETINEGDPPPHTARGVHNPAFSISGLARALNAVEGLNP